MINVLPPEIKQQIIFAKRNAILLNYLVALGIVGAIITASFVYGEAAVAGRMGRVKADLAITQSRLGEHSGVETKAKTLSERLTAIKKIQSEQTNFSSLLYDLGNLTPKGVFMSGIDLTGESTKPISINATANSYELAVAFKERLVNSVRFQDVDIISITSSKDGVQIVLSANFKAGRAK